jgi:hypothetical protein
MTYCDNPSWVCPHVRKWGGDAHDRRRYVCARDADEIDRGHVTLEIDPKTDRLVAREGCGYARR